MIPDLLITWIKHSDYPIFRMRLRQYRDFFGKIVIYWSEHFRDIYFDDFIQNDLADLNITFLPNIEYQYGVEDWRNVSTNYMLSHSQSDWICSIEQDFFVDDWPKFFETIRKESERYDLLGYKGYQGQADHQWYLSRDYVHPCCWFIKRELLEQTSKDFSADQQKGADHFGLITRDVEKLGFPIYYLQDHGWKDFENCFHLGGVNQNYLNGLNNEYTMFRPEIFTTYNACCRLAPVRHDPRFLELSEKIEKRLVSEGFRTDTEWRRFFV